MATRRTTPYRTGGCRCIVARTIRAVVPQIGISPIRVVDVTSPSTEHPTVATVVAALDSSYPPATAEAWDSVGLIAGDPSRSVRRVLFALDPTAVVVAEAKALKADLVVTHHPLFLRPVHSVAATTFKGAVVHELIAAGIGLYNAHTNADAATGGVGQVLADALGLRDQRPLIASDADPATGIGRCGRLPAAMSLAEFARLVVAALPHTAQGVRVAGVLDARVETVAVLGGSGDGYFAAARAAGADVYLTSDLRHHPASEAREQALFEARMRGGSEDDARPFLVDTAHWASESPWLQVAAAQLARRFPTLEVAVSAVSTDPWTAHFS